MANREADAVSAGVGHIKGRYGSRPLRSYADAGDLPVLYPAGHGVGSGRHEFVCTYCERGQCARCNDRACTCCYGNED